MSRLAEFLLRNSVQAARALPLVHTTQAYHIRSLKEQNLLKATQCDIFEEKLNYFFVGKPAYKHPPGTEPSDEHEFPCCFIFDFSAAKNIKRIFPFDSGGFQKGLFPDSVKMMDVKEFEAGAVADAPERIIGAFFGNANNYFHTRPKKDFEEEYGLTVIDAELRALHRLAAQKPAGLDDRKFAIEIQNGTDLDLTVQKPLAVVAPTPYWDLIEIRDHVEKVWGAQIISYPIFSLNQNTAYGNIYEKVLTFYQEEKLI